MPLDKLCFWCIFVRVSSQKIPTLLLPTSDYEEMRSMSNRRLVAVLRSAVLAPEKAGRFHPRPPAEYDAYMVKHELGCISVLLHADGRCVFCCRFKPADDY